MRLVCFLYPAKICLPVIIIRSRSNQRGSGLKETKYDNTKYNSKKISRVSQLISDFRPNVFAGELTKHKWMLHGLLRIDTKVAKRLLREFRSIGCVPLGNPDLDVENRNPDFPIECTLCNEELS